MLQRCSEIFRSGGRRHRQLLAHVARCWIATHQFKTDAVSFRQWCHDVVIISAISHGCAPNGGDSLFSTGRCVHCGTPGRANRHARGRQHDNRLAQMQNCERSDTAYSQFIRSEANCSHLVVATLFECPSWKRSACSPRNLHAARERFRIHRAHIPLQQARTTSRLLILVGIAHDGLHRSRLLLVASKLTRCPCWNETRDT